MAGIRHRQFMRLLLSVVLAAAGFMQSSAGWAQTGKLQSEIGEHEQKLAEARRKLKFREEATELNLLGELYRQAGKPQKGLESLNHRAKMAEPRRRSTYVEHDRQDLYGPGAGG